MKELKLLIALLLFVLLSVPLFANEPLAIRIENVKIDIEEGTFMGSCPNSYSLLYNQRFRNTNSFTENELINTFEKLFVRRNFKIPGWGGPFRSLNQDAKPDFAFAVKINELNLSWRCVRGDIRFLDKIDIDMSVTWYIMHIASEQIIFSASYKSELKEAENQPYFTEINSLDFKFVIKQALDLNIDQLLSDSNYQSAINNVPAKAEIDSASFELITLNKVTSAGTERANILKRAQDASVTIVTATGHGSGFFIDHHGLILTCYHVVQQSKSVEVALNEGTLIKAKVVRSNPDYDLALLQIDNVSSTPIGFSSSSVNSGDEVFAIGSPAHKDLGRSLTRGIVSAERLIEDRQYIQTDASVSPGNSGGPLINQSGEVVGVVNAKAMSTGTEGVAFAIPVSVVMEMLNIDVK
jgi:S1-C subfamily serine protease